MTERDNKPKEKKPVTGVVVHTILVPGFVLDMGVPSKAVPRFYQANADEAAPCNALSGYLISDNERFKNVIAILCFLTVYPEIYVLNGIFHKKSCKKL